jgi:hypothetical protein
MGPMGITTDFILGMSMKQEDKIFTMPKLHTRQLAKSLYTRQHEAKAWRPRASTVNESGDDRDEVVDSNVTTTKRGDSKDVYRGKQVPLATQNSNASSQDVKFAPSHTGSGMRLDRNIS